MALEPAKYNKLEALRHQTISAGLALRNRPHTAIESRIADPRRDGYNTGMTLPSPMSAPNGGLSFRLADLAAPASDDLALVSFDEGRHIIVWAVLGQQGWQINAELIDRARLQLLDAHLLLGPG